MVFLLNIHHHQHPIHFCGCPFGLISFLFIIIRILIFVSLRIICTGCFFLFVRAVTVVASNGSQIPTTGTDSQIPTTGTGSTSAGGMLGVTIPLCNGKKSEPKWQKVTNPVIVAVVVPAAVVLGRDRLSLAAESHCCVGENHIKSGEKSMIFDNKNVETHNPAITSEICRLLNRRLISG